jgi:hypothetical protein
MFCVKLASWNIHIKVLIGQSYRRRNQELLFLIARNMCSCAAKKFHKAEQLV